MSGHGHAGQSHGVKEKAAWNRVNAYRRVHGGRRRELEALLDERFGITHTTLQVDHDHGQRLVPMTCFDHEAPPAG
jgi:hypothetical protein